MPPPFADIRSGMTQSLSVAAAFAGRGVLITGATGYVGSLVLEQLLRVCPAVGRCANVTHLLSCASGN